MFPRLPTFLLLSKLTKNFCKTDHRASLFNFIPHSHETLSTRDSETHWILLCGSVFSVSSRRLDQPPSLVYP